MTDARQLSEWDHTAAILCVIQNLTAGFSGTRAEEDYRKLNPFRVALARRIPRKIENTTVDGDFAEATIGDVISAFVSEDQ